MSHKRSLPRVTEDSEEVVENADFEYSKYRSDSRTRIEIALARVLESNEIAPAMVPEPTEITPTTISKPAKAR
jgi:hypothetical protein